MTDYPTRDQYSQWLKHEATAAERRRWPDTEAAFEEWAANVRAGARAIVEDELEAMAAERGIVIEDGVVRRTRPEEQH